MRATVTTSKPINLVQLASELGGAAVGGPDIPICISGVSKTIWAEVASQGALDAAIAAHTLSTTFGVPLTDQQIDTIKGKAQAVFDGTDTFTAAQLQKLVATLVLKATR